MIDAVQPKPAVQPLGSSSGRVVEAIGRAVLRYGLVVFLVTFGLAKFTEFEAVWIQQLLASSPLFSWMYGVTSVQGASNIIGIVEITLGVSIGVRRWWPGLSAIGSLGAAITFVCTFSFLFTTPNASPELGGFLMKDLILFGAALWSAGEALQAWRQARIASPEVAPAPRR
jgi:reactive chlorine resistance protein C